MASNETQIVISARDNASATLRSINQQFDAMRAPIGALQGAVAGLGAAFAGLAIVSQVKGALAMADEIGKLAQKTGVAVEEFSKLSYAAKLSDVSNEQLAKGLKQLSKNMSEAAAGTGESVKYFQALGVSLVDGAGKLKSTDAIMGELADKFSGMQDGATKTATAMAIFGKSGSDLIPMLNSGSDGLRDMADEATRLGLVMSTDMAKGAEQFNDNLTRLSAASQGLSITLGNQMLPALTGITNAMVDAAKEGGLLQAVWVGLGGLGAALFTDEFASPEKKIKNLQQEIMDMQRHLPDVQGGGLLQKWLYGSEAEINAGIANARSQIAALENEMADASAAGDKALKEKSEAAKKAAEETEKRLRALLAASGSGGGAARESDYSKLNTQISERIALLEAEALAGGKLTEGEKLAAKVENDLANGKIKLTTNQKALLDASLKSLTTKEKEAAEIERQKKGMEQLAQAEEKHLQSLTESVSKDQEALDAMVIKNDLLLQGIDSQGAYNLALLEAQMASMDFANATYEEIDALEKRLEIARKIASEDQRLDSYRAQKRAAEDAAREWQKSADEINRSLTDALMRGFESGKGFAANLKDTVVNMFKTMVLRPVISAVLSPVSGAITTGMGAMGLSGTSNAANAASTASSAYNLYNSAFTPGGAIAGSSLYSAGSFFGSSSMMGYGAGVEAASLGAVGSGATVIGAADAAAGSAAFAEGAAAASSGFGSALAAIPGWGWAAMGALAVFGSGMFDSKGGPKTEGNAFGTLDSSGNLDIQHSGAVPAPYGDGDWNRPGADAARIEGMLTPVGKSIGDYIARLGGSAAGLGIYAGYNTDPQGSAPDNVTAGVRDAAGNTIYGRTYDTGRGEGAAALAEEMNRVMLAAVQAVDLGPVLTPLMDGLGDVGSLTKEQVDKTLSTLAALGPVTEKTVQDIFGEAFDASKFSDLSAAGESTLDTFVRLSGVFESTNAIAEMLGKDVSSAFGEIGLASADMRQALIDGAGGMDALSQKTSFFYQNFYTDAERAAREYDRANQQVVESFSDMGIAVPSTTAAFRDLVEGLDLGTASGQAMYQSLMNIAPAFDTVAKSAASAAAAAESARQANLSTLENAVRSAYDAVDRAVSAQKDAITAEYDRQAEAISASIDGISASTSKLKDLSDSLHSSINRMRPEQYAETDRAAAQAQVEAALAIAKAGGVFPDAESLRSSLDVLSKDSSSQFATREDYLRDSARTAGKLNQLADLTDIAVSVDEKQLAALEDQLSVLEKTYTDEMQRLDSLLASSREQMEAALGIDSSVKSVEQAINDLNAAIYALAAAQKPAMQPYNINDTPAERAAKVEAQTGVVYSASDDPMTAAAKILYQSTHGGASTADYNAAAAAVGGNIGAALGWDGSMEDTERLRTLYGFASGGSFTPGWALVGEEGPELVNFAQPGRVYTAADTQALLAGDNAAMLDELRALRSEVSALRYETQATAGHTGKTARLLERVMPDGDALSTRTAA